MVKLRVCGRIASNPIVVNLQLQIAVYVLIDTIEGYQEFFYSYPKYSTGFSAEDLARLPLMHIALSSMRDEVVIDVVFENEDDQGNKIRNFYNQTRSIGFTEDPKLFEELGGFNFNL